ncbi:MAG TPA: hypothetical protein VJR47_10070 [Stellaceae bacterium]|nr:hypothetical protein [Stellaceae bacterium]
MDALAIIADPAAYCDESLKLRHKVQKLHWMGLDHEAEQIAREIEALERRGPMIIVPLALATD